MDFDIVFIALAGLTLAGVVKGATGLGYASCALPFLVLAVGLKTAMAVVIVPAMATNVSLAFMTGNFREVVTRFQWLYVAMFPGVAIGVYLLQWVSQPVAIKTLGMVIMTYVIFALARPDLVLPVLWHRRLQWPTGLLNGIITGLTGAQVMPLFPYVMSLKLDADRTVQVINIAVLISTSFLAIGLIATGIMTPTLLGISVLAVGPAIAGTYLGNFIRQKIPVAHFRRIVLCTLLLVGFVMLAR